VNYIYVVLAIAALNFVAGVAAFPDGPEKGFWVAWLTFTVIMSAITLPIFAVVQP
jgi:hypothetical protein